MALAMRESRGIIQQRRRDLENLQALPSASFEDIDPWNDGPHVFEATQTGLTPRRISGYIR